MQTPDQKLDSREATIREFAAFLVDNQYAPLDKGERELISIFLSWMDLKDEPA